MCRSIRYTEILRNSVHYATKTDISVLSLVLLMHILVLTKDLLAR